MNYSWKRDLPPISWYVVNELASSSLCSHSYINTYFVHHSFNIDDVWCCILTISILKYLSTDYDECTSTPCLNGGTCVNGKRKFSCICPATHKGDLCEGEHHICIYFSLLWSTKKKIIIAQVYHDCLEHNTALSILRFPSELLDVKSDYHFARDTVLVFNYYFLFLHRDWWVLQQPLFKWWYLYWWSQQFYMFLCIAVFWT